MADRINGGLFLKGLNFISIDVETTGLEENCEIIEIGLIKYREGVEVDSFHSLVKPLFPIPQEITNITGITNEMVSNQPKWSEIEEDIYDFLQADFLVGHNVAFDRGFIERALQKPLDKIWVDTLELAKIFLPKLSSYKLISLVQYFGLSHTFFHRAYNDAQLTAEVFLKIIDIIVTLHPEALNQIIEILKGEDHQDLVVFLQSMQKYLIKNYAYDKKIAATEEREIFTENTPLDLSMAETMLKPGGLMSQRNPKYEYRPHQVEMLLRIIDCFQEEKHGLLEGGTGIGKSFAYLIPAILWSLEKKKKVVVATHTIALQEQLYNKDIPFLEKVLEHKLATSLVKGRSNYICLRRYQRVRENKTSLWPEKIFLAGTFYWLHSTQSGDKEELNLNSYENEFWAQIANQQETCLGSKCSFYHTKCFFFKNRRLCENSNLLITNHALLLQDIKNENKILPKFDYCIIDEAHNLDDEATEQFSDSFDFYQLKRLCSTLTRSNNSGLLDNLIFSLKKKVNIFYEIDDLITLSENVKKDLVLLRSSIESIIEEFYARHSLSLFREIRLTPKERNADWWISLEDNLKGINNSLTAINLELFKIINGLELEDSFEEILKEISFYKSKILKFKEDLEMFLEGNNEDMVYWISVSNPYKFKNILLVRTPLTSGKILNEYLFEIKKSVILTSATLTIANNFKYMAEQYGLENNYLTFNAKSPFNYDKQSLVCIPNDLPDPAQVTEENYTTEITNAIIKLAPRIKGGVLVLFTSYSMLNGVYTELKKSNELKNKTILAQGKDGNRKHIIDTMQKNVNTLVLGTNSFWEGIDVSGENLSAIIIVKLPFLPPTRPVIAARLELLDNKGLNSFSKYSLPQAVLKFRQGYGRLIRTKNDKGAIIILDKRVITKRYGREFLKSLPSQSILINTFENLIDSLDKWYGNIE